MGRFFISLLTGLLIPLMAGFLAIWSGWTTWKMSEVEAALWLFGPFTLAGSFLVVWPVYALQPKRWTELRRATVVLGASMVAGIMMLLPFLGWVPYWIPALFALATASLWLSLSWFFGGTKPQKKEFGLG